MPKYLVTETRELVIEAPSAASARAIGNVAFHRKLSPSDLKPGITVTSIQNTHITVEKVQ